ncbi:response regulator transcription factor [Acinetobacter sp. Ac_5812]|uniref:response regulator n=1 Tax=Acinetobacter sp. Ac_5812 TaxID=1848937 RepID=UPI00148FB606|nr:response regulator transcription factor [Acinetobacter sp. Ac_5812]NNP69496.1 DNA-binding response regulator [Acinetobacter sp. Ac_5812]
MISVSQNELTLPVPVFILEDDAIMQQRLKKILLEIGYTQDALIFAQTLAQGIETLQQSPISFALVDLGLPDGNGTDFIEKLRQMDESSPVLVISAWSTQETILKAIQTGATGYLLKERDDFEITLSIRSILRGGAPIDPFIAQQILSKISFEPQVKETAALQQNNLLSTREFEILQLVSQGMSNREIADFLHLSKYTIECHIKHIYRKLSVSSRSKAINTARSLGLL